MTAKTIEGGKKERIPRSKTVRGGGGNGERTFNKVRAAQLKRCRLDKTAGKKAGGAFFPK